nr:immunoglobulin heavy chain junction region [Mus musculus]
CMRYGGYWYFDVW